MSKIAGTNICPQNALDDDHDVHDYESETLMSGSESDGPSEEEDGSESNGGEDAEQKISSVSFAALQQAQDSLSRKRKRGPDVNDDQDSKLQALRARLKQIKSTKEVSRLQRKQDDGEEEENSDSDSGPEEEANTKSRSSKHAPMEQTSRRPVTRMRTVIEVPKRTFRDPRFDALSGNSTDPSKTEKKYSFLVDYQKAEIAELQAAMKKSKSEEEKETLKRKVVSMQNRLKAKENAAREQEVLRKHRKEEKERIEQGKQPFFLKKKDVKERALVEKFKDMKGKDREKLMERRRKKEGQKEKKRMPEARRGYA